MWGRLAFCRNFHLKSCLVQNCLTPKGTYTGTGGHFTRLFPAHRLFLSIDKRHDAILRFGTIDSFTHLISYTPLLSTLITGVTKAVSTPKTICLTDLADWYPLCSFLALPPVVHTAGNDLLVDPGPTTRDTQSRVRAHQTTLWRSLLLGRCCLRAQIERVISA